MSVQAPKPRTQVDPGGQKPRRKWTPQDYAVLAVAAVIIVAIILLVRLLVRFALVALLSHFGWIAFVVVVVAAGVGTWYLDQRSKHHI